MLLLKVFLAPKRVPDAEKKTSVDLQIKIPHGTLCFFARLSQTEKKPCKNTEASFVESTVHGCENKNNKRPESLQKMLGIVVSVGGGAVLFHRVFWLVTFHCSAKEEAGMADVQVEAPVEAIIHWILRKVQTFNILYFIIFLHNAG